MELTVENIIKIIIGVVVVAVVAYGLYYFFTNKVIDFFKNFGTNTTAKFFMALFLR
jgi:hypothetical protein